MSGKAGNIAGEREKPDAQVSGKAGNIAGEREKRMTVDTEGGFSI